MLHQVVSSYGRIVPKPEKKVQKEEVSEEAIPIQDQIENLRTKISLKDRYNKVLKDDLEQSHKGISTVLEDLYADTLQLRMDFMDAILAEKTAVQSALRTHHNFELAMTNKNPDVAIGWLEDKIFDCAKQLDILLQSLAEKRSKLEQSESMVLIIEKWPRPGSLPWEQRIVETMIHLENLIEAAKVKRETAMILYSKYKEIRMTLQEEQGKYAPNLRNLESQLDFHKMELRNIDKMAEDAALFREDAEKNLLLTEKEAYDNRRKRRRQMNRMKKAVQAVLEANNSQKPVEDKKARLSFESSLNKKIAGKMEIKERMKLKQAEIEEFQDRARRLVQTMRVPDLTHIPQRLKSVMILGGRLQMEQQYKEQYRDLLIKHKNHLLMISFFFKYTGYQQEITFAETLRKMEEDLAAVQKGITQAEFRLQTIGDSKINTRLGIIALLQSLDEVKRDRRCRVPEAELLHQLKILIHRIKALVKSVTSLKALFLTESEKKYGTNAQKLNLPGRLIRVGSPVATDESDGDDDYGDFKVPSRLEIKTRSYKFIHQALLRRGNK